MPGSLGDPASTCAFPEPLRPYASTQALMPFMTPDTSPLTSLKMCSCPCTRPCRRLTLDTRTVCLHKLQHTEQLDFGEQLTDLRMLFR